MNASLDITPFLFAVTDDPNLQANLRTAWEREGYRGLLRAFNKVFGGDWKRLIMPVLKMVRYLPPPAEKDERAMLLAYNIFYDPTVIMAMLDRGWMEKGIETFLRALQGPKPWKVDDYLPILREIWRDRRHAGLWKSLEEILSIDPGQVSPSKARGWIILFLPAPD